MARPLTPLRLRRLRMWLVTVALALPLLAAALHLRPRWESLPWASGWALAALTLLLVLYNLRKKLPFLPLGHTARWAQLHYYGGVLTTLLFLIHLDFRPPAGLLTGTLAALFAATALSGLIGLALCRVVPRNLAARCGEIEFARIPAIRGEIAGRIEALIGEAMVETRSTTLGEFHRDRLLPFLGGPRNRLLHVVNSDRPEAELRRAFIELERYLDADERARLDELRALVLAKNDLDFHYTGQWVLRHWLHLHIPLAWGTALLVPLHLTLVHAFMGGG